MGSQAWALSLPPSPASPGQTSLIHHRLPSAHLPARRTTRPRWTPAGGERGPVCQPQLQHKATSHQGLRPCSQESSSQRGYEACGQASDGLTGRGQSRSCCRQNCDLQRPAREKMLSCGQGCSGGDELPVTGGVQAAAGQTPVRGVAEGLLH